MKIEQLTRAEGLRLRRIRLRALEQAPEAFATTLEEAVQWQPASWHQQLERLTTFVATERGDDVGLVRCSLDEMNATTAWLLSMWVAPEIRKLGVGGKLIDAVLEWAADNAARRVVLEVGDDNVAAIALYDAKGFKPNGEVSALPAPRDHLREHQRELQLDPRVGLPRPSDR